MPSIKTEYLVVVAIICSTCNFHRFPQPANAGIVQNHPRYDSERDFSQASFSIVVPGHG